MRNPILGCLAAAITIACAPLAIAGTDIFFNPLTQSAAVASPNHLNELSSPWQVPAGLSQEDLLSLQEVEADANQSIVRVPAASSCPSRISVAVEKAGFREGGFTPRSVHNDGANHPLPEAS